MVELNASRFAEAARRSGLVNDDDLARYWESIPVEKRTIDRIDRYLARRAVEAGKLTIWQAQVLLQGRSQGLRLGKYVVRELLGQGGMGRVYLALDTQTDRLVALKILAHHRTVLPRALARFSREARLGLRLKHQNLIRMYETGEFRGRPYIAMEYIQGISGAQLITRLGRVPPPIATGLVRQVAQGLEHLHQNGLLHRDVTPANILIDRDGTAKLADLGLALDLDDREVLTRDGSTVGTLDYMSPEQARHPRSIDVRSDIYALGGILFHMIAGELPFPMESLSQRVLAHQLTEAPSLSRKVPECPPELDAVVHRMLRKLPEDRFSRPAEVALALAPFASEPLPLDQVLREEADSPDEMIVVEGREPNAHVAVWFDSNQVQETPPVIPVEVVDDSPEVFLNQEAEPERPTGMLGVPMGDLLIVGSILVLLAALFALFLK